MTTSPAPLTAMTACPRHPCRDCQEELYAPARAEKEKAETLEMTGGLTFALGLFPFVLLLLFSYGPWPLLASPPLIFLGIWQFRSSGQHEAAAKSLRAAAKQALAPHRNPETTG